MLNGSQWTQKPPLGTPIDRDNPLGAHLGGFWPLNEGTGLSVADAAGGLTLAGSGYTSYPIWSVGQSVGVDLTQNAERWSASLPTWAQIPFPITLAVGFRWLGAGYATGNTLLTGALYDDTAVAPSECWTVYRATNSNNILLAWNAAGVEQVATLPGPAIGVDAVASVTYTPTNQYAYLNGTLGYTGSVAGNPTYASTAQFVIGAYGPIDNPYAPNALVYWVGWLPIALDAAGHASLAAKPWQVFAPPLTRKLGYFTSIPTSSTAGVPAITGIGYQFNEAVNAGSLSIVVTVSATGATVPGTVSYNSTTHLASFIPSATTPLVAGVKYLVTVSGATALDGTLMTPVTFPFQPGGTTGGRWTPALGRSRARLRP